MHAESPIKLPRMYVNLFCDDFSKATRNTLHKSLIRTLDIDDHAKCFRSSLSY